VNKYSKELFSMLCGDGNKDKKFTKITLPQDEDVNGFYAAHNAEALNYLINERTFILREVFFSSERSDEKKTIQTSTRKNEPPAGAPCQPPVSQKLNAIDSEQIHYNTPDLLEPISKFHLLILN